MKEKPLPFKQIEWWLMSILFLIIILTNILNINFDYISRASESVVFRHIANIVIPLTLFGAFYFMHMKIIPNFSRDGKKAKLIIYSLLVFFISVIICTTFYIGADYGDHPFMPFYFSTVALYLSYFILVYIYNKIIIAEDIRDFTIYNIIRLITLYVLVMVFLFRTQKFHQDLVLILYAMVIPAIVAVVIYNYFLIYNYKKAGRKSEARAYYWLLASLFATIFIVMAINIRSGTALLVGIAVIIVMIFVIIPASNAMFAKYDKFLGQINTLSVKVNQGTANMDFLRSQINPHFLFNALNTLYGTALQETAERTGEGIQKLGDMMRFMLHENNQENIPVEREKEYLVNYVDLQMLRIKDQENIEITFNRNEAAIGGMIAPMLLVPFVENAFKHGISFQKKSWIKISLRCLDGSVHLDVNNSIHRKDQEDPEYKASGIGLENVRQRLKLLYPDEHELIIRENDLEFFVHLSIKYKNLHA
ncbi:sensor histidine kinase [Anditalea andensis]|uniref:Histidine kinase n=1 Tax=Anditalea andensis TaxID=1048983 RepID=A0A074L0Z0_9BACT|nr:histidine kinase [Anditalea andensis]KEO74110.1 histidine kinase [Anditalea andensis]